MPKTGELRVGIGWVCATAPSQQSSSVQNPQTGEEDARKLVQQFLEMLFHRRDSRAAFDQFVHLEKFTGHLPDGSCTALETLLRLQAFVDSAQQLTIKTVAIQASQAFVRVERVTTGSAGTRQHLMQLTLANGKIVDYFGSIEN